MIDKIKNLPKMTQTQFLVFGFLGVVLIGSLLLMLPISSKDGSVTPFIDCLFTAVSAACVTGLVVVDTFSHWTIFGQIIILLLIQIGGLGFITMGVLFSLLLRRRIGLKTRGLMQESVSTLKIGGVIRLTKKIFKGTLMFEGIGAILLSIRFSMDFGIPRGIYFGIFHSVSAFCNAGFDLLGVHGKYISLTEYEADPIVNIVIMSLIVIGGIGFIVWDDISINKLNFRKYRLQTKIVLLVTTLLIFLPAGLFYILEYNNTMKGMNVGERIYGSLFSSVTARTAGFNTIDTGLLKDSSKLLTMFLMFIGGSPGSTAGGIKTTTFFVLLVALWSSMKNSPKNSVFNRRFTSDAIGRASIVFTMNTLLVAIATFLIVAVNNLNVVDVMFEAFSAMGTVGMSTGVTRSLNTVSKIVIITLMFCGRVGSLSFALSFLQKKKVPPVFCPEEKISIG